MEQEQHRQIRRELRRSKKMDWTDVQNRLDSRPKRLMVEPYLSYTKAKTNLTQVHVFFLHMVHGVLDGGIEFLGSTRRASIEKDEGFSFGNPRDLLSTLYQMSLCKAVDNFLTYLSDLLNAMYHCQPKMMSSKKTVTYEYILQFSNMDDLISDLVQKTVHDLSYKGIEELAEFFQEKHGLSLFKDEEEKNKAGLLIEMRNVLTHNHGIVSPIFKQRIPDYPIDIGMPVASEVDKLMYYVDFFDPIVNRIDEEAIKKYGLPFPAPSEVEVAMQEDSEND